MMFIDQSIISVDFRYFVKNVYQKKKQISNFSTNIYVVGTKTYTASQTFSTDFNMMRHFE